MLSESPVAVTLPVQDLEAAKRFYEQQLALPLREGSVREGFLEFEAGGGTMVLLFRSDATNRSGNTAATFAVGDLAGEMEALRKRGVAFAEYDLPGCKTVDGVAEMGGHAMAWIEDPEGNVLALWEK